MPRTVQLSVELWQCILRYAISVPDFLDPKAFDGVMSDALLADELANRSNEAAYWLIERHRRSLEQVCKSWYAYLGPFQHRFVRMLDIWHGKIPPASLKHAVRVSFSRYGCECLEHCHPELDQQKRLKSSDSRMLFMLSSKDAIYNDVYSQTLNAAGPFNTLEIVDTKEETFGIDYIIKRHQNFQQVKIILGLDGRDRALSPFLLTVLPNLRHFYGRHLWLARFEVAQYVSVIHQSPFDFRKCLARNMVTLLLTMFYLPGQDFSSYTLEFPSLRHLRVRCLFGGDSEIFTQVVIPLLKSSDYNVRSLYFGSVTGENSMPPGIWELCPRLERLGTETRQICPPPLYHPIHTFVCPNYVKFTEKMGVFLWPNIQKVVIEYFWGNYNLKRLVSKGGRRIAASKGIRIEDLGGLSWEEHILLKSESLKASRSIQTE